MPTDQKPGISRITASSASQAQALFIAQMPRLPDDVKTRFPSLVAYEAAQTEWMKQLMFNVRGAINPPPTTVT